MTDMQQQQQHHATYAPPQRYAPPQQPHHNGGGKVGGDCGGGGGCGGGSGGGGSGGGGSGGGGSGGGGSGGGRVMCANCGAQGHMYRICHQPISSFGVVCYRVASAAAGVDGAGAGTGTGTGTGAAEAEPEAWPEYLMVQRKDSLSYVEFIRGKYNVHGREYVLRLLRGMTAQERERLATLPFDELWSCFWQSDRGFVKEYEQSRARFAALQRGVVAAAEDGGGWYTLAGALQHTAAAPLPDTEFGFPKGRRNINESDARCALREFGEETLVDAGRDVELLPLAPFVEVFVGSNGVRYRHVYFVARLLPGAPAWDAPGGVAVPTTDAVQLREVKATGWFGAEGVLARISEANPERREAFLSIHRAVCHQLFSSPAGEAKP